VLAAALLLWALPAAASGTGSAARPAPKILSASWGTDNAVGCPSGAQGLDNIPVTFEWFIRRSSVQATDFRIVRSDGSAGGGPTPVAIRLVGALRGKEPGVTPRWRPIPPGLKAKVEPLSGGPYIVDAWTLTPALYRGDPNRCITGNTFVRVMWSNGLTAYSTGAEVGAPVVASYRALYRQPDGKPVAVAPLEVADLDDHPNSFNADNMHDLCLPRPPAGARLAGVTIAAGLIQDPNGDPNLAQKFRAPRPG
jgi:hypothetical protein